MSVSSSYRLLAYQARPQAPASMPSAANVAVAPYQAGPSSVGAAPTVANPIQADLSLISQQLATVQQQAMALIAEVPAAPATAPVPAAPPAPPVAASPTPPSPAQPSTQGAIAALKAQLDALQQQAQALMNQVKAAKPAPSAPAAKPTPKPAPKPAPQPAPVKPITDRNKIYLHQPNGWTCGPTSLTMAAAAFGVRPANDNTVNELTAMTHTKPAYGVPDHNQIPNAARKIGLQASPSETASPAKVRAALKAGHGVILNGSLGSGGHFIYVAGLNPDGSFIICDPWRSNITSWNDAQLNQFATCVPGHNAMVEIWK